MDMEAIPCSCHLQFIPDTTNPCRQVTDRRDSGRDRYLGGLLDAEIDETGWMGRVTVEEKQLFLI